MKSQGHEFSWGYRTVDSLAAWLPQVSSQWCLSSPRYRRYFYSCYLSLLRSQSKLSVWNTERYECLELQSLVKAQEHTFQRLKGTQLLIRVTNPREKWGLCLLTGVYSLLKAFLVQAYVTHEAIFAVSKMALRGVCLSTYCNSVSFPETKTKRNTIY